MNYAFTFGLIFDVSIYRGRAESINLMPEYAGYVRELISLRKKYLQFFTEGKFNLPSVPPASGVKAAEYSFGGKRIMTVWNDSDKSAEICGKTIPPQGADIIETEN